MLLETRHLSKQFNGIYALKDIHFSLEAGEVHGLVGENGAGKSTLIKILTGVYALDTGEIYWNGEPLTVRNPSEARKAGISVIHQDRTLVPTFTGVENAYLGMPYPTRGGRVDWKAMEARVAKTGKAIGIELDWQRTAAEMSPPQRTCLEIVRAMMNDCRLLILDEPTASLTDKESEWLFSIIDGLRARGTAILYVTHRMEEIFRLTDRITVFKNGEMVGTVLTREISREALIGMMSDNWVAETLHGGSGGGEVLLRAEHLRSRDGIVRDASLEVRAGEILGLFGLGGSGRTELLECLYGYRPVAGGTITIHGQPQTRLTPEKAIRLGVALISEDRRGKAMIGNLSVRENVALSCLKDFARHGVVDSGAERPAVREMTDRLRVRMAGPEQRAIELSGGNQQKVVFAKALMTHPQVFLCDEPTQAVDVMTRGEIHRLLREEADQGRGVLFVSSDLKEVLEVADRVQIIVAGETRETLENRNLNTQQVLACCYREE
ncbi:MAG: sugar ABC transporter ATP-binding protein [Clostridia bacterium]|nr:sugar ABC transporter ATP-binding protein [Clostridia bacterium]